MYAFSNDSRVSYKPDSAVYTPGLVAFKFTLLGDCVGNRVGFLFTPSTLGVAETAKVPLYPIYLTIPTSINSVPVIFQSEETCAKKAAVTAFSGAVEYVSYGVMLASAIPCKVVGLELMGVLQLSFISLGNIDHLNPLLSSLTQFSGANGLKLDMDDQ